MKLRTSMLVPRSSVTTDIGISVRGALNATRLV